MRWALLGKANPMPETDLQIDSPWIWEMAFAAAEVISNAVSLTQRGSPAHGHKQPLCQFRTLRTVFSTQAFVVQVPRLNTPMVCRTS
jgi:hypothetical protein